MLRNALFSNAIISYNRYGQQKQGVEYGPNILKKFLKKDIKIYETRKDKCLFSSLHNIYINNCKVKGRRVNIGGDHSTTIATGAYTLNHYKNPKFLWFDAHGDINDYKNSLTKNYHGMVLSYLMGTAKENRPYYLDNFLNNKNLMYIGIRDLDPYEKLTIKELKIPIITVEEVNTNTELSIKKIKDFINNDPVHLSFDVDGLDPQYISSTGTPVENGMQFDQTKHILDNIITDQIVNLDICEYNPELGDNKNSLKNVVKLFKNIII